MKKLFQESFKKLLAERRLFASICGLILITIIVCLIVVFSIQPSNLQQVAHYSAFGISHLYTEQWFYLFVFLLYPIIVCILHIIIAIKILLTEENRSLALVFVYLALGMILLDLIFFEKIIKPIG
jgi:TRAP-type C4-dicarboxylate transport system permease small subunit